ncbi:M43 family zinc metalloprotease [Xanthovirga aplysinae]|uniref:M43 family zinc metalloprotease n=1 Tax=Xanthovirga aplysinae TaxID=2529853 RepID=UPI0012BC4C2C|nr:M43 family zinc metalloprotease [Xanthovirga aplysinae]MTI30394.1 hypothetical protein [Xanthovirga aplysinae]
MKKTIQKQMLKVSFLLVLFSSSKSTVWGQGSRVPCGTEKAMKKHYNKNPVSKQQALEFDQFTREFVQNTEVGRMMSHTTYTIPVVVHVFGEDFEGYSVDDNIIKTALEKVNEDFHGLNPDFNEVIPLFRNRRGTLDVSFELAKLDPNGNPTTGINYYPQKSGFGQDDTYDDQIRQYAWDNYKYMNLYVMLDLYADGATNNSGVGWYPDSGMSDNNTARIVYNGRYLWGNDVDNEFQATLTHEFGHYLNLIHTFEGGCNEGDQVDDTPATTANYDCNTTTVLCSGAGIPNASNYMDYSSCRRMFTVGQINRMSAALQHPSRHPLWQESNLQSTGIYGLGPHLLASGFRFYEDVQNNGGIENSVTVTAEDGAEFAVTDGDLIEGIHFTASNIPSGLSVRIQANSSTSVTVSFEGNASFHSDSNDLEGSITFLNPAIVGGTSGLFNPSINNLLFDFINPYQIVYGDMDNVFVNTTFFTWVPFELGVGNATFGGFVFPEAENNLKLESGSKALVCENNSRNISLLEKGDPINSSNNWVEGGFWNEILDLRSTSYRAWEGRSGYIGFQFTNEQGRVVNGWFQASVSSDGTSYTLYDFAYHEDPNATLYAGESGLGKRLALSENLFFEDDLNDGTIAGDIVISAEEGAQFAVASGFMTEGTHFTTSNVPSGLNVRIQANGGNSAVLTLEGTASSHNGSNDISDLTVNFLDAAFIGSASSIYNASFAVVLDFANPYEVIYKDIDDITVNSGNTWGWFYLHDGRIDDFVSFMKMEN